MRGRTELAFFVLALLCLLGIVVSVVQCALPGGEGKEESASSPGTAGAGASATRPDEVAQEFLRRYYTFTGNYEAWRQKAAELASDPLRGQILGQPPEPEIVAYRITMTVLGVETVGQRQAGDTAQVTLRGKVRATPGAPGGEWTQPRERERLVVLNLRKEGERWTVYEMDLQ